MDKNTKHVATINCKYCGSGELVRIDRYDALACRKCYKWLENTCEDPDCWYCKGRPETAKDCDWDHKENSFYHHHDITPEKI